MKFRSKMIGVVAALSTITFASPVLAQNYDGRYGDRYDNGRYYEGNREFSSRDDDLLNSVRDLMSEVQANRYNLRTAFLTSAMRNLRSVEDNIRNARYQGGLNDRQYVQNRNLLNRTEIRIQNELRTARTYNDDDGRYAYRR